MAKQKRIQKSFFTLLVLSIVAICISANAAPASNDMLNMLPSDTLFAVKANNLDYALGNLDQFLAGASPVPMGTSMLLRMQLGQLFGSPELAGINTAGNFTIFGKTTGPAPQPNQAPPMFLAVAVPVTDYNKFIEANPNCGGADARKISKLIPVNKSMIQAGQYAIIAISGTDDQLIETAKKLKCEKESKLAPILNKTEKQNANQKPFWAYCNMELINKNFGPMMNTKFQETKSMMQTMASQNPQMANSLAIMDVYFQAFDCLLNETKSISATLSPSPETLNAQIVASALPETQLAEMFQTNTAPKEKFAQYLNDNAVINFIFNPNPALIKAMNSLSYEMMASMNQNSQNAEEMKTIADSFVKNVSGPIAASIMQAKNPGHFFAVTTVAKINDVQEYQKGMDAMAKFSQDGKFNSPGINMNFKIDKDISKYKNTNINSLKMDFKAQNENSPEAQAISSIFGNGLDAKYAFTNNFYLYALGDNNTTMINQLIDKTKSSSNETPEEIKKAFSLIEGSENADIFVTFNILRICKTVMAFSPIPLPQMPEIPTKTNIVLAAKTDNGQAKLDIAVPKDHIKEIMSFVQTIQMQQMQQSQPAPASAN